MLTPIISQTRDGCAYLQNDAFLIENQSSLTAILYSPFVQSRLKGKCEVVRLITFRNLVKELTARCSPQ